MAEMWSALATKLPPRSRRFLARGANESLVVASGHWLSVGGAGVVAGPVLDLENFVPPMMPEDDFEVVGC